MKIHSASHVAVIATNPAALEFIDEYISHVGPANQITLFRNVADPLPITVQDDRVAVKDVNADDFEGIFRHIDCGGIDIASIFGWPKRFPRWFVEKFNGRFFNMHSGDLPGFRGAGGGSWQVLQDARIIRAQIHIVEAELDAGAVVMSEAESIDAAVFYPLDVKAAANTAAKRVARRFAVTLAAGEEIVLAPQDQLQARYFPRLCSVRNAWISTDWSCIEFERFVRAFSDPYPGAMIRYRNQIVRLKRAARVTQEFHHPYCRGLIVARCAEGVFLALSDGVMLLSAIHDMHGRPLSASIFTPGDRLWTSVVDLQEGHLFRPGFPEFFRRPDFEARGQSHGDGAIGK